MTCRLVVFEVVENEINDCIVPLLVHVGGGDMGHNGQVSK